MPRIDKTIEVHVPVGVAYNQWTQFERFPSFMEGIEEVRQIDAARIYWAANVSGVRKEWYARILRQVPDRLLAWKTEAGTGISGTVIFKRVDEQQTEIELHMRYSPEDRKEQIAGALGFVTRQVGNDLLRFKEMVEDRGYESGAWRGEITHGRELPKAPFMDSSDAPDPELIQFGVTAMDSLRNSSVT